MYVTNTHTRIFDNPKSEIEALFESLATEKDLIWPIKMWPKMSFKNGKKIGSKGGHGPIRYTIEKYEPGRIIQFRFYRPIGFDGIHKFELLDLNDGKVELKHIIEMRTRRFATLKWIFGIRSLHDALVEDAFDNVSRAFSLKIKTHSYTLWTRVLRFILKM